jgi:hypothetical protein
LKKLISVLAVVLLIFQLPLTVSASDAKLYTNNVSAKSNRLFDVYIDVKSPKIVSAATFTLSYNPSAVAFRNAGSNISGAEVKSADNNGKVKVIILIPNGVKVNKKSSLLSVRFKALQAGSSEIKISPSDFVDVNAKNFKAPSPVKSKVITDGKSTPIKRAKSRRAGKTATARKNGKNIEGDADVPEGDADAADGLSPEDEGLMSAFDSTVNGDNPNLPIIILVAVCAVLTAAGLIFILKKTKDDKNDKDK